MSVNPFELAAPKKELPKELQALFDDYFVHYIAGLNCYGDCKASDEAADKALKKLIGYLCAQKGLPADGLEEGRGEYVIYLSDDRKLEKSVAVDFEMLDYSEDLGEISFSLDARYRNDSAQDWKEKLKLKASPQAQEKLKVFREEEERKRTAEGKERRMQYDKYLPGALSFLRSHGNGLIKHDELGALEPMLKNYFRWNPGAEDSIQIGLDEDNSQWVIKLLHPNGSVYDVFAIDDKI
ncbi:MAG: hypothetical protein WCW31_03495 [Patescibacteria group bacterium]